MLFDRINISQIFKRHVDTLYDHGALNWRGEHRVPIEDKLTFGYFPIILSIIIVVGLDLRITKDYLNILITALSIFVGLLFSLLTLVFDLSRKEKQAFLDAKKVEGSANLQQVRFILSKELFINIAFAIALSIVSIIASLLTQFYPKSIMEYLCKLHCYLIIKEVYLCISNVLALSLILVFVLTLLMILKRFFLIFTKEIEDISEEN